MPGRKLGVTLNHHLLLRDFHHLPSEVRGGAVAIGNFDGVHLGHAVLMEQLVQTARACQGPAVVLTFDPSPLSLLKPQFTPPKLTTVARRAELLSRLGVDWVIAYPTDLETLQWSAEEFFSKVIIERLGAKGVVEGENFFFGKDRRGNIETLKDLCRKNMVQIDVVAMSDFQGKVVSSSRVRELLMAGDVVGANRCLTSPYQISGTVVTGARRGRDLGFPTANIEMPETLVPAVGVYGAVAFPNGKAHRAAVNIGPNPSFGENQFKIEVHILDFQGDLYGSNLTVEFRDRVRDIRKFSGIAELREQLVRDIQWVRENVASG
ncbi:MAG: Riboflavin kinase [Planctomycetota bacterium]|jgi:riboflavin kinase/FMN adenylyltransferase